MASRREVRCRCGRQMWVHPEIRAVQCSNCYTVTQLYSLLDTAHGGNHMVHGFQQPRRKQQQQPQMMAQPPSPRQYHEEEEEQQPPMTMTQPPSPRQHKYHEEQEPQMMTQPPPQHQYHEQPQQMMMTQLPPRRQYHEEQEPQMMTQPSPQHQYPEQQPQMMIDRPPPKRQYPKQQMMTQPPRQHQYPEMMVQPPPQRQYLVFHFSGHGSQQKDYNGDEIDGQDETICPLDHETEGKIIDDEINRLLVRPLVHGAKLHAIIDACNSGTVLDLPFVCRMERNGYYEWEDQRSVKAYKGTDGGSAFCFSACDDHESSGYTRWIHCAVLEVFTGKNAGTMTHSFIKAVKIAGPAPTYGHLLNLMCSAVREAQSRLTYTSSDTSAEPVLTSSEEFDVYTKKFLL